MSKRRPSVQVLLWTFYSQIVVLTKTSRGGRWGEESFSWVCSQGPRKPQVLIVASCLLDGPETLELHAHNFKSPISTSQERLLRRHLINILSGHVSDTSVPPEP